MQSVYKALGWEVKPGFVTTNTPANTPCRAPGSVQGMALIECIMEHVSHFLNKDPLEVRQLNFLQRGDELLKTMFTGGVFDSENLITKLIDEVKVSGNYDERKAFIENFNSVKEEKAFDELTRKIPSKT
jgi:xanthine dehydrogenase molybdopterin-binding subunit B